MLKQLNSFTRTAFLGGVTVILPVAILWVVFHWLFQRVTQLVQPLTNLLVARSQLQVFVAELLAIVIILAFCFAVGVLVRTRLGAWLFHALERSVLRVAPGYNLVKEIVMQVLGAKKSPFSSVALVQLFGNETLTTAFVTDEHANGYYTVFVPTGPNPTSGMIYHLPPQAVHLIDIPAESAVRSIISCGVGSQPLLAKYPRGINPNPVEEERSDE